MGGSVGAERVSPMPQDAPGPSHRELIPGDCEWALCFPPCAVGPPSGRPLATRSVHVFAESRPGFAPPVVGSSPCAEPFGKGFLAG